MNELEIRITRAQPVRPLVLGASLTGDFESDVGLLQAMLSAALASIYGDGRSVSLYQRERVG